MKRSLIFVLSCCLSAATFAQTDVTLKKANRGDAAACATLAREAIDDYRFDEAVSWIEKALPVLKKKKLAVPAELTALSEEAKAGERMLRGTDQMMVVDSFVVDKAQLLSAYHISSESGTLDTYAHFFGNDGGGVVYCNELGNRAYFGKKVAGNQQRIFTADRLADDTWSEHREVIGLGEEQTSEDYPFVSADGLTLYFASQDAENGMGGYDIYVTRVGSETSRYLRPENLGMPYNSPYNDYLYVVDELNGLGWFASDRYQPEGKVCVYVFVPNESRMPFDYDADDRALIRAYATLRSLAVTQVDKKELAEARLRLKQMLAYVPNEKVSKDFDLVIDDAHRYTRFADFKQRAAADLARQWAKKKQELTLLQSTLESNRIAYSKGNYKLAATIRGQEAKQELLAAEVHRLEKAVRAAEQKK